MKRIITFALVAAVGFLSVGCKKVVEPELDYYPKSFISEAEGGTYTFKIECNTTWTIEDSKSTVSATIQPLQGEGNDVVTVTVPENNTGAVQQVRIKISAKGTETVVVDYGTITINAKPFIGIDNSRIELPAQGGGRLVHVTANGPWSANGVTVTKAGSNSSWCDITRLESDNNIELNISAGANESGDPRYAKFILSLDANPDVNCVVEVSQEAL